MSPDKGGASAVQPASGPLARMPMTNDTSAGVRAGGGEGASVDAFAERIFGAVLGGKLLVDSTPQIGTTLVVEIPYVHTNTISR